MKIWVKYVQDMPPSDHGMLAPEGIQVAAAIVVPRSLRSRFTHGAGNPDRMADPADARADSLRHY